MFSAQASPSGVAARRADLLDKLLVRTAAGDQEAFRLLYDRTSGRIFAICLRIAKDRSLAEDFLQEAYARIWERSHQFDPSRGSALAWIIAVARNYAIDVVRMRSREVELPDDFDLEAPASQSAGAAEASLGYRMAWRCLAELEEGPRRAIMLAYRDGFSHAELATLLEVPVGTVKSWIRRGIEKLRVCLDDDQ